MRSRPAWFAVICALRVSSAFAGESGAAAPDFPCVDVQIGGERADGLDCLNQMLARQVERAQSVPQLAAPIDAQSASTVVGTGNVAVARETMGDQFGKSAIPQRPRQIWVNPLLPALPH